MNTPLINILTRISRPAMFSRLVASIDYDNVNHITYDDTAPRERKPYDWNLFCNELKSQVTDGWFVFADDDDTFKPGALNELSDYLTDDCDGLIVQFLRNGRAKPANELMRSRLIVKGKVGGGCLVLHSRHKNVADWKSKEAADYDWIRAVADKVELKFVQMVLQVTDNNGRFGK